MYTAGDVNTEAHFRAAIEPRCAYTCMRACVAARASGEDLASERARVWVGGVAPVNEERRSCVYARAPREVSARRARESLTEPATPQIRSFLSARSRLAFFPLDFTHQILASSALLGCLTLLAMRAMMVIARLNVTFCEPYFGAGKKSCSAVLTIRNLLAKIRADRMSIAATGLN